MFQSIMQAYEDRVMGPAHHRLRTALLQESTQSTFLMFIMGWEHVFFYLLILCFLLASCFPHIFTPEDMVGNETMSLLPAAWISAGDYIIQVN